VDSSVPPPPRAGRNSLRPWYLVAAMVLTWFAGVHGLTTGCTTAMYLRDGAMPDVNTAAQNARGAWDAMDFVALVHAVEFQAMRVNARVTFPLAVAQALLAGLLVVASGLAMNGRRGARSLALQAVAANALLATLAYAATRGVRVASIEAVLRVAEALPAGAPQREILGNADALWWTGRIKLVVFDLGTLALGMLALTRTRTKLYFDAVARAPEGPEDP